MRAQLAERLCGLIYCVMISQSIQIVQAMTKPTTTSTYARDKSCNFQGKLDNGCVEMVDERVHTSVTCGLRCSLRDACEGYSLDAADKCYLHFHCVGQSPLYTNCSSANVDIRYFVRKSDPGTCMNGGRWDQEKQNCSCVGGFLGIRCERYAENCAELEMSGQYPAKAARVSFYIKPSRVSSPMRVYCHWSPIRHATYRVMRNQEMVFSGGSFTFNKSWDEYVNGFFDNADSDSDGWIGLETLHYLNTVMKLQTLFISPMKKGGGSGVAYEFYGVKVGDNSTNYQLSYDSYSCFFTGMAENVSALVPWVSTPVPFSTPDVDNDLDPNVHCAKEAGAGWWFSECSPRPSCNPFGIPYQTGLEDVTPDRVHFAGMNMRKWPWVPDFMVTIIQLK